MSLASLLHLDGADDAENRVQGDAVPLNDYPSGSSSRDHTAVTIPSRYTDDSDDDTIRQDEASLNQSNSEVVQLQKRMMDDQDETLNALSTAISRQRDLSLNISSELELHSTLLDETDMAVDATQSRLSKAATKLERVGRKTARENSATCIIVALVVILLLLIVLLK